MRKLLTIGLCIVGLATGCAHDDAKFYVDGDGAAHVSGVVNNMPVDAVYPAGTWRTGPTGIPEPKD